MTVETINTSYDGHVDVNGTKADDVSNLATGTGIKGAEGPWRSYIKFSLSALPSNANITQVRLKLYCNTAGGAAHLLDIHAYSSNGSDNDPASDTGVTLYNRCASGNLYVNDSASLRSTGTKWFTLGSGESAQACVDVENAIDTPDYYSVGLHEEGDNDDDAFVDAIEAAGSNYAQLEVTYTTPAAGQPYISRVQRIEGMRTWGGNM